MSSSGTARLRSWLRRSRKKSKSPASSTPSQATKRSAKLTTPVENYYRHRAKAGLASFYRFALQTRSLAIRDIFAKISSKQSLNLLELLAVVENVESTSIAENDRATLAETFDSTILLTLGDLLANTARDELDTHAAVQIYTFVQTIFGGEQFSDQNKLQFVEALNEIESYSEATSLAEIFNINEIAPSQQELLSLYRMRRTSSSAREWVKELNRLYRQLDMTEIRLIEDESLPLLDRLTVDSVNAESGPKITVIMPTFSPGPGIRTAIRSLLEQSWQNLEIIVVNDASPAEYRSIFDEIEQLDSRISVIHQDQNAGPYVARNAGLLAASGEFVTTHDDDDWSHPDKLASQVQVMLEDTAIVASTSAHIRTTENAEFRRLNMQAKFMQMNYSSLMFRRSVAEEIGPWDTVNRGGDSEFYTRLLEYYGDERIVHLHDRPLSFSRVWDGSLTSGEMSRGYFAYSRLLYRWAFRQWHWSSRRNGQKAVRKPGDSRPYAIPPSFELGPRDREMGHFDVIYVTDFFRQAKYVRPALQEIEALAEQGLSVGYIHLYSPETIVPAGIPPRLFELQMAGKVTQINYDDQAEAKLLVLHDPAIGMFLDQLSSKIKTRRGIVIDHQLPTLTGGEPRSSTALAQTLRHLDTFFGTRFEMSGNTVQAQARLHSRIPQARLAPQGLVWHTPISTMPQEISPPTNKPIIGFHSYGNRYRWPANTETFRQVYISSSYTTRLFGNLETPFETFGAGPFEQVEVITPEDQTEAEFLKGIDFWVYYPHHRLEDQVWEQALSAMQAGKVVILPPRLKHIYGEAAAYADQAGISGLISRFVATPEAYIAQAARGQDFVNDGHTAMDLRNRVVTLMQ